MRGKSEAVIVQLLDGLPSIHSLFSLLLMKMYFYKNICDKYFLNKDGKIEVEKGEGGTRWSFGSKPQIIPNPRQLQE